MSDGYALATILSILGLLAVGMALLSGGNDCYGHPMPVAVLRQFIGYCCIIVPVLRLMMVLIFGI